MMRFLTFCGYVQKKMCHAEFVPLDELESGWDKENCEFGTFKNLVAV